MTTRTSATRYARALLDIAVKESSADQVEKDLSALSGLFETNPELQKVLTNPAIPAVRSVTLHIDAVEPNGERVEVFIGGDVEPSQQTHGWVELPSAAMPTGEVPLVLSAAPGAKSISVSFRDSVGNLAAVPLSVAYDPDAPPGPLAVAVVLIEAASSAVTVTSPAVTSESRI